MKQSIAQEMVKNAVEKRNQQIANLLWNTGKLTEKEIKRITSAVPTKIDGMHGV